MLCYLLLRHYFPKRLLIVKAQRSEQQPGDGSESGQAAALRGQRPPDKGVSGCCGLKTFCLQNAHKDPLLTGYPPATTPSGRPSHVRCCELPAGLLTGDFNTLQDK
ncbi:hypothetical protein WMY93_001920 [Mugilogobius chulae]|uniref:G protein gamma domain-containing protein n=1 Tax=Mugilogobius chulae TaxID=88201 RepID=A0AAW0Q381_9GOBI